MRFLVAVGGLLCAAGVVAGTYYFASHYFVSKQASRPVAACLVKGASHVVTISHDALSSPKVTARLCDTLAIVNNDSRVRLIAFGPHDHHTPYDGVAEQILDKGQSLTIVLNEPGTYTFHDHLEDSVAGYFTVMPN